MNAGLLTLALTIGQPVAPAVPPAALPAAPFVFVKLAVTGTKTTWYPGSTDAVTTSEPVGLRPGYVYRMQLSDIPGAKGAMFFPSIEVRGSLVPRPGFDVRKHPIPIVLTEADLDRIADGRLVTKVYYLEDPEQAIPVESTTEEPLEFAAASEEAAVKEARLRGRPMLIFRVGEKPMTKQELMREHTSGTILLPGAKSMPIPAAPPYLPFAGVLVYDPIIGAKGAGEECLADGGDIKTRVGAGPGGVLHGLDPSDTALRFTNSRGITRVAPSNRVCICVPRFAAIKVDTVPAGHHIVHQPVAGQQIRPVAGMVAKSGPGMQAGVEQPAGYIGRLRPSGVQNTTGIAVTETMYRLSGLASVKGLAVAASIIGPEEITAFPGCNSLLLQKRVDPPNPDRIGQEVTFFLRFTNPTGDAMHDVLIADSLTARLEYLEGTAKCSRGATFKARTNTAGSVVLEWTLDTPLQPGESGTISFKAKIR